MSHFHSLTLININNTSNSPLFYNPFSNSFQRYQIQSGLGVGGQVSQQAAGARGDLVRRAHWSLNLEMQPANGRSELKGSFRSLTLLLALSTPPLVSSLPLIKSHYFLSSHATTTFTTTFTTPLIT
jgi:hypothetical protein